MSVSGSANFSSGSDVTLSKITTPVGIEYQVRNTNGASGNHVFKSFNTAILTLDGGTNAATFASSITMGGDLNFTPNNSAISFASGSARFFTGGSEKLTITSGGSVGIGTTNPQSTLQVNGNFRLYTTNGDGNELRGIFNVGGAADPLSLTMYKADATTIGAYITADGASYFNSGNFLIGTATDGGYKFEVRTSTYNRIVSYFDGSYTSGFKFSDLFGGIIYNAAIDTLTLFANYASVGKMTFETAGSEKMRITSGGIIQVNTTASIGGGVMNLNGDLRFGGVGGATYSIINYQGGALALGTNNTEFMRLNSSGFLKVSNDGTYYNAAGTYHEFRNAASSGEIIYGTATNASYTGTLIALDTSRAANTAFNFFGGGANGVSQFRVSGTGVIYAQNTTVQAISSDRELKTDIVDFNKGLAEILAMKPRYFKYKDNLELTRAGFIAQEMEEALPGSMIDGEPNRDGESFKTYQIDWYPILVKAIQELKAEVDDLKSQLNK
jgi:hypothetical protein